MEDAEQRHRSMTLIFITASSLLFLFCRRGRWHRHLKHLLYVFFFGKFCVEAKFTKKGSQT